MVTTLDIVDTAIKVGLGALISGVTTYFVTTRTHSHEVRNSLQNEKKELLKEASIKLEACGGLLNEINQAVYIIRVGSEENKEQKFREISKLLTTAYNAAREARSLCYMIGQIELAKLITSYCDSVGELSLHYQNNTLNYDAEFVETNGNQRTVAKNQILEQFSKAFDAIYER